MDKSLWARRRSKKASTMIGRMYSPNDSERYCLRLLLLNTPGAKSFNDLRTHEQIFYDSFKDGAIPKNLLTDDNSTL